MNKNVWTVSLVNRHIKEQFEYDPEIQGILVAGEISNFTAHSSGHWYFTLKDTASRLSCVMFKSYAQRNPYVPKHGDKVLVSGSVRVFEPNGQYQLYCVQMVPYGEGELNRKLEILRQKLQAEGLFDDSHKKSLPAYPEKIGVICGEATAAYQDVKRTVARRWPVAEIIPFFSLVQGAGAKEMLVEKIHEADNAGLDVILIVRGGGSLEDLWSFNEEDVVRAVFGMKTPVVSGVGHESDTTLVDYAADLRASTPTAAAEHATPDIDDVTEILEDLRNRLVNRIRAISAENSLREDLLAAKLLRFAEMFSAKKKETDLLKNRLASSCRTIYQNELIEVRNYKTGLSVSIKDRMSEARVNQTKLQSDVLHAAHMFYEKQSSSFRENVKLLDAYSPLKILARGYGAVYDEKGKTVRTVKDIHVNETISVRLTDGTVLSEIKEIKSHEQ